MAYWITEAPANTEPQDGENGRSVLPNGVIIMWGTATNGGDKCLFHTPFPNNCFAVNYTGSSGQRVNLSLRLKTDLALPYIIVKAAVVGEVVWLVVTMILSGSISVT